MKIKYTIKKFNIEKSLEKLGYPYVRDYMGQEYKGGRWFGINPKVKILLTKEGNIFCEHKRVSSLQSTNLIKSEQDLIGYLKNGDYEN